MKVKNKFKNKTVFVALSGGVDSSVVAYLLKSQGANVVGVYFKTYKPLGDKSICKQAGESAQKVAQSLQIPFRVYDFEKQYKEKVFNYLIQEYQKGRTPNPDIICNKQIKFDLFARKALSEGADYIATGHYASVVTGKKFAGKFFGVDVLALPDTLLQLCDSSCTYALKEAKDANKDQSYFLSQIDPQILKKTIFPAGKYLKPQIRKIAQAAGLHTYNKKDSQGICFIGQELNIKEFLQKFIKPIPGDIKNTEGQTIGKHKGVMFYTIGERRGVDIFPEFQKPNQPPLYVVAKNLPRNELIVGTKEELKLITSSISKLEVESLNMFFPLVDKEHIQIRIRHRGAKTKAIFRQTGERAWIEPIEPLSAPAEGQFVAFYKSNVCAGSGVIAKIVNKI